MEISDIQFKESVYDYDTFQVKNERPAVIDLYADWCGVCKGLSSALDTLAQKYDGKVDIIKVNITKADALTNAMNIQGVPTLLFLDPKKLKPAYTMVGLSSPASVEKTIAEYLLA